MSNATQSPKHATGNRQPANGNAPKTTAPASAAQPSLSADTGTAPANDAHAPTPASTTAPTTERKPFARKSDEDVKRDAARLAELSALVDKDGIDSLGTEAKLEYMLLKQQARGRAVANRSDKEVLYAKTDRMVEDCAAVKAMAPAFAAQCDALMPLLSALASVAHALPDGWEAEATKRAVVVISDPKVGEKVTLRGKATKTWGDVGICTIAVLSPGGKAENVKVRDSDGTVLLVHLSDIVRAA